MIAGTLDEIIKIHTPIKSKNEYGEESVELKFKCSTRARLIHNGGGKGIVNFEAFYSHTKMLQVRHYVDVKEFDVIEWNREFYNVIDITPNKAQMMQEIVIELKND